MPYINKRKVQIVRGTSSNLINTNKYVSAADQIQSPGQPAFISDKYYLTVGSNQINEFNKQVPIRVRTVEGWTDDKELFNSDRTKSDSFILSPNKSTNNHYRLTGEKIGEESIVYLSSAPKFELRHKDTPLLTIDNNGTNVTINPNKYLYSNKLRTTNIQDNSGNERINFNNSSITANFGKGSYTINLKDNIFTDKILYVKNNIYTKKLNILESIIGWTSESSNTAVYSLNNDGTITASKSLTVPTINNTTLNTTNINVSQISSNAADKELTIPSVIKQINTNTINTTDGSLTINGTVTITGTLII